MAGSIPAVFYVCPSDSGPVLPNPPPTRHLTGGHVCPSWVGALSEISGLLRYGWTSSYPAADHTLRALGMFGSWEFWGFPLLKEGPRGSSQLSVRELSRRDC